MLRNEFRKIRGCPIWWATGTSSASWGRGSTKTRTYGSAGDLLLGKSDAWADNKIDDNALVYTMLFAKELGALAVRGNATHAAAAATGD